MSEPIKVGDLVAVIGYHCRGEGSAVGLIRTVVALRGARSSDPCLRAELDGPAPWLSWHIPLQWLKRIQPLEELDDVKQDEEISA